MSNTRHTSYSRPRRGRTTQNQVESDATQETDAGIGEPPRRYMYKKSTSTPIRIRKGPGFEFEHNGKYIGSQKSVEVCEVDNGWGLLADYQETRDGWVCLEFLDSTDE